MTVAKFRADPARRNRVAFSASQVDTFRQCPRKWFLHYVAGVKSPPGASQEFGTKIHAEIEGYLITGNFPGQDAAARTCAQAALKNLPKPGPDLLVEQEFVLPLGTTAPGGEPQTMGGFVDLAHGRALGEGKFVIRDHKTTKDYVWNKTEAELRHNTQAVTYAVWGYSLPKLPREGALLNPIFDALYDEGFDEVEFGHHYVKTQKPLGSVVVTTPMPWAKVSSEWVRIQDTIAEMTNLAANGSDDPKDVAGNPDHCDAYGGCFFGCGRRGIGYCSDMVSGGNLMKKVRSEQEEKEMEKKAMNIRERLAARKAAQQGGTTAPATEPAKAPESPAAATSAPPPAESPAPAPTAPAASPEPQAPPPAAEATGVVPPDAPPREQSAEEAAALAPPERVKKRAAAKKAGKTVAAAAKEKAPTTDDVAAAEAKVQEKAEEVRAAFESAPSDKPASAAAPAGLKIALVDCLPIDAELALSVYGGDFVPAERWLDPVKRAVAEEFGESDYALIEFGKGKAALAAAIKATADSLPRLIYVSSFSRSADVLVDELIAQGYLVQKAVRG